MNYYIGGERHEVFNLVVIVSYCNGLVQQERQLDLIAGAFKTNNSYSCSKFYNSKGIFGENSVSDILVNA